MKKIDLHVHTLSTASDLVFSFDLDVLKRYVSQAALDAIAITNHNVFDRAQYTEISDKLEIEVYPGIEINIDRGHILVISDVANLDTFEEQTIKVSERIKTSSDFMSISDFITIFQNLEEYLVIPHYGKKPALKGEAFERIATIVSAVEVDSPKKFIRTIKDEITLTPVIFSDVRISKELPNYPTRQTFVDCGEISFSALKICLADKSKVALSESDGNKLFEIFDDGQKLSTGLNVLLGERSTGKTYTLNRIYDSHEYVKYIKQFSLVQQNDNAYEREFSRDLKLTRSQFVDEYLSGFKLVLNDVMNVDLRADDQSVEHYLSSLLEAAEEADRRDAFSNTALFDESEFPISEDKALFDLIGSIRQVIENVEYRPIIEKYLDIQSLKQLAVELIEFFWNKKADSKKKKFVNSMVHDIKEILKRRTSAVQIQDVDLYRISLNKKKVERFREITKGLQAESTISEEAIQSYSIVATKKPFAGAGEIKSESAVKTAFKGAFEEYDRPYEYLQLLLDKEDLKRSELYRLFVNITYRIMNRDGFEVSGGERSEFKLLQEIKDAQNYNMLLIDEPESSFDNMFLRSEVNQIIKEISGTMPVVVVTHNNTVGASAGADYLIYASKEIENDSVVYRLYSGYPTDLELHTTDGRTTSNHVITLNALEAGSDAYEDRRRKYEAIKD